MTITLSGGDDTARVVVTDHGAGVPPTFVPRLFDRFARAPGQAATSGSGLGLYIARRLAEANDGTIAYEPGPDGDGAVFTLTVPRVG